jgi:hypothetical protein
MEIDPENKELNDRSEENDSKNGDRYNGRPGNHLKKESNRTAHQAKHTQHDRHGRNREHDRPDAEANTRR